jgi:hypothetical protein
MLNDTENIDTSNKKAIALLIHESLEQTEASAIEHYFHKRATKANSLMGKFSHNSIDEFLIIFPIMKSSQFEPCSKLWKRRSTNIHNEGKLNKNLRPLHPPRS